MVDGCRGEALWLTEEGRVLGEAEVGLAWPRRTIWPPGTRGAVTVTGVDLAGWRWRPHSRTIGRTTDAPYAYTEPRALDPKALDL